MRNTELFDKIADAIEKDPKIHNQVTWGCGTSRCIAGHAAAFSGAKPYLTDADGNFLWSWVENQHGNRISASDFSTKALGLDWVDADSLFDGEWKPPSGQTVPEALRAIGRGADIERSW